MIFGTVTKYEPDRGKGGKQNYTVECILEKCYGDACEEQMIRALSARTLQYGGPMNETAMLAKVNPINIPVLEPGTPRVPFRTFAARYKIVKDLFPVRGDMLYVSGRQQFCETNAFDDLVSRYRKAYGVTPTFQPWVAGHCRSNDVNRSSYALFPLGIVVHRACDYTEAGGRNISPRSQLTRTGPPPRPNACPPTPSYFCSCTYPAVALPTCARGASQTRWGG